MPEEEELAANSSKRLKDAENSQKKSATRAFQMQSLDKMRKAMQRRTIKPMCSLSSYYFSASFPTPHIKHFRIFDHTYIFLFTTPLLHRNTQFSMS